MKKLAVIEGELKVFNPTETRWDNMTSQHVSDFLLANNMTSLEPVELSGAFDVQDDLTLVNPIIPETEDEQ